MLKTSAMLAMFAQRFPKRLARPYRDFVGLMTGRLPKGIRKVYLALDMETALLDHVLEHRPDVVLTHHPLIYGTRYRVLNYDPKKAELVKALDKHKIPVYSLHTNFDEGRGGMNDALAEALALENIRPIEGCTIGRGGRLPHPMTHEAFVSYAKEKLHASYGLWIGEGAKEISTVALVGGGGAREYGAALKAGFDVFISGDAPHHVRRGIVNDRFNYLDLPHEIEEIFVPTMKRLLLSLDPTLVVIEAPKQRQAKVI